MREILQKMWKTDKEIRKGKLLNCSGTISGKAKYGNPLLIDVYIDDVYVTDHVFLSLDYNCEYNGMFTHKLIKQLKGKELQFLAVIRPYDRRASNYGLYDKEFGMSIFR